MSQEGQGGVEGRLYIPSGKRGKSRVMVIIVPSGRRRIIFVLFIAAILSRTQAIRLGICRKYPTEYLDSWQQHFPNSAFHS
jgi:hypothetical protein